MKSGTGWKRKPASTCTTDRAGPTLRRHGKALVLTEEPLMNSFAESLAGRIQRSCFRQLDAPVFTLGAADLPAIALNVDLERQMLPNADKVAVAIGELMSW